MPSPSRASRVHTLGVLLLLVPGLASAEPHATPPPPNEPTFAVRLEELEARVAALRERHLRRAPRMGIELEALSRDTAEVDGRIGAARARIERLVREMTREER